MIIDDDEADMGVLTALAVPVIVAEVLAVVAVGAGKLLCASREDL